MKKITFIRITVAAFIGLAAFTASPAALAQSSDKPFTFVEQMPQFEGGDIELLKFLGQTIKYPEDAHKAGIEGMVVASFVVAKDGALENIELLKGLSKSIDAEALRVVKLMDGKWKPGKQNGKVVAVKFTLPIRFNLDNKPATSTTVDQQPQFKGGQEALMQTITKNLKLPAEAKKENLNARVLVRFTVEKDGSVSGIKLENTKLKKVIGPGAELDYMDASSFNIQNKILLSKLAEAAVTAIKASSGQWQPAVKNGKAVPAEVLLPIQFNAGEVNNKETSSDTQTSQSHTPEKPDYDYVVFPSKLDQQPTFKEGKDAHLKFFAKHLRYPDTEAEGDVTVSFIVYPDGSIGDVTTRKSMGTALKNEVLRVLELSKDKWQPGMQDGKAVKTYLNMTFRFITDNRQAQTESSQAKQPIVVVTRFK